jgi:dolichol kinase
MLAVIGCLAGLFALLVLTELLGIRKILKGEYLRKFLHITSGTFIAFWPWLISWRWIQVLAVLMVCVMLTGRFFRVFIYHGRIHRVTYGDIIFAVAILVSSFIAGDKVFFALAILEVALADGLAAVVGISYGKQWGYKVFGYKKTVVGTMVFWIVSITILAAGLLAAHSLFSYQDYYYLLLLLPPVLTILENLAVLGIDNLVIPLVTIAALRLFQS